MNKKIPTPIAIIVVVLCVIIVGGFIAWQYFGIPEEGEKISEEITLEDETADWKTYRNEEYGFEMKYPKSWYVYTPEQGPPGLAISMISTFSQEIYENYVEVGDRSPLQTLDNLGMIRLAYLIDESLEEALNSIIEDTRLISIEEINIEGEMRYKMYFFEEVEEMDVEGVLITYLFSDKNNKTMLFQGTFIGKDKEIYEEYAEQFEKMLSTFSFID